MEVFIMENIQFIRIGFDFDLMTFSSDIIELNGGQGNELKFYQNSIDCRTIDIVNLSKDVCIIIDDEGLLKSGNPVFEVKTEMIDEPLQLAGTMLFAGQTETDEGAEIDTLSTGKCLELLNNLKIRVIGVTK